MPSPSQYARCCGGRSGTFAEVAHFTAHGRVVAVVLILLGTLAAGLPLGVLTAAFRYRFEVRRGSCSCFQRGCYPGTG